MIRTKKNNKNMFFSLRTIIASTEIRYDRVKSMEFELTTIRPVGEHYKNFVL